MTKKQASISAACKTATDQMLAIAESIGAIPTSDLNRKSAIRLAEGCGKLMEARASLVRAMGAK